MARLKDLGVAEVSLVDFAANKRRFLLTKNEGAGPVEELLALILDTEAENESEIDAVLAEHELEEDTVAAMRGALRLMNAHRDNLTPEIVASLVTKAGFMPEPVVEEVTEEVPAASDDPMAAITKADGTLDLDNVPEAVRPALERLWREKIDATEQREELEKALNTERIEKRRSEFVTKAADLKLPNVEDAFVAELMMKVQDDAPDLYEKLEKFLGGISSVLKDSAIFQELGGPGDDDVAGSAYEIARKRAAPLIAESDGALSESEAIDRVFKQDKELAARHAAESRGNRT